jgi:hypothetical protein
MKLNPYSQNDLYFSLSSLNRFSPLHGFNDGEGIRLDVVVEHHLDGQRKLLKQILDN